MHPLTGWIASAETLVATHLGHPGWALAALLLGAASWWRATQRAEPALAWPAWPEAAQAGARSFDAVRAVSLALRALAIAAVALALGEPFGWGRTLPPRERAGGERVLLVDASASMEASVTPGAAGARRLALAREAARRLALRRVSRGLRVALVVFGESALTLSPLTSDERLLGSAFDRIHAGMAGDATALGDALALGVKRGLAARARFGAEPSRGSERSRELRLVLLSDGESNAGSLPVDLAAELAAARGIAVDCVAVGVRDQAAATESRAAAAEDLRRLAARTGGRFLELADPRGIPALVAELDDPEPVAAPTGERRTQKPHPAEAAGDAAWAAWLAAGALALELAWVRGLWRRLP